MKTLKTLITGKGMLVLPGVYDGLSSLIAEQAGAKAIYLSGGSIAYTRFGKSDLGLVDMNEVAQILAAITDRVGIPVVADADNGYGNALNVQRTVRTFERAGASGIQIEDQTMPKRCGHLSDKTLIPKSEMVGKVMAAVDARRSADTLIVARTDAIAVEGFDKAVDRAVAYADAGADVLFVEAPRTIDEMKTVVKLLSSRLPLLVNMVEGGKTPFLPAEALEEIGFKLAIFPGSAARAVAHQLKAFYPALLASGTSEPFSDRMVDFDGINAIIGTARILEHSKKYSIESVEKAAAG